MFIHFSFNLLESLRRVIALLSRSLLGSMSSPSIAAAINIGNASSASVAGVNPLKVASRALARFISDISR